jgi:tetratricopeptide (TPR) repeat protein
MSEARALAGRFLVGGLPPLLRELYRRLVSGRLDVTGGGATRRLWFEAGQVRAVVSDVEEEKLGKWLVGRGVLDGSQMALALLRQPEGVRFGAFLVQEGALTVKVLEHELEALSVTIVSRMLVQPGEYRFNDGERLPMDAASIGMTTASLLAASVRGVPSDADVKIFINPSGYVWTAQDALLQYQQIQLTPQEGYLLSRVDGTSTTAQLQRLVPMPGGEFSKALAALLVAGVLEIRENSSVRPLTPTKVEAAPEPPAEEELQYNAQQQREYADVLRLANEIRHKDYYRRLGLSPGATQDQIHSRFLEFAKLYHPDRAREPHLVSVRNELAQIYSAVQEAHDALGNPEKRASYEQSLHDSSNQQIDAYKAEQRRRAARGAVVDANVSRAKELARAGDVGMAVHLLDQAVRLNPQSETLLTLARLEFKNPMWSQRALDHLKHAVALAPEYTEAWLELANFWGTRNKPDRQRQCLEKILEFDPHNEDVKETLSALKRQKPARKR